MSAEVEIAREDNERGGRYTARLAGFAGEGELTYRRSAPDVVVANHTGVPSSMQGQGVAAKLVERLVADARAEGFRIVPACSYVAAQRKRHPEWADLFV
jgi:predicted GNAT family acetyltransferase